MRTTKFMKIENEPGMKRSSQEENNLRCELGLVIGNCAIGSLVLSGKKILVR